MSDLANNHLLMFSYGSGLASTMFSLSISSDVSSDSPLSKLIDGIRDVPTLLANRIKICPKDFESTLKLREETHHLAPYTPVGNIRELFPGTFYLTSIDEMYRRKYDRVILSDNEKNEHRVVNNHVVTLPQNIQNSQNLQNGHVPIPAV